MRSCGSLLMFKICGTCRSAAISLFSSSLLIDALACAICSASIHSVTTCVAKALVLATPFSMPARVSSVSSARRTIEELSTLQIASVFSPACLAIFSASRVSAVSPLCEMTIKRAFLFSFGRL